MPGAKRSDRAPLSGRRILVTRAAEQAPGMVERLAALGAVPVLCPTIAIVPPTSYAELDAEIARLAETDYLVLTSANAVEAFFARLVAAGLDAGALAGVTLVTVGPKTAEQLAAYGVRADLLPATYDAEGVVALLRDLVAGKRVLYPRAALAREVIARELAAAGAVVAAPVAYASAAPPGAAASARAAVAQGLDLLTFTAASTVGNFVALLEADALARARAIPVAVIGPQTAAAARKHGFMVAVAPAAATLDELLAAIVDYFRGRQACQSPNLQP